MWRAPQPPISDLKSAISLMSQPWMAFSSSKILQLWSDFKMNNKTLPGSCHWTDPLVVVRWSDTPRQLCLIAILEMRSGFFVICSQLGIGKGGTWRYYLWWKLKCYNPHEAPGIYSVYKLMSHLLRYLECCEECEFPNLCILVCILIS